MMNGKADLFIIRVRLGLFPSYWGSADTLVKAQAIKAAAPVDMKPCIVKQTWTVTYEDVE